MTDATRPSPSKERTLQQLRASDALNNIQLIAKRSNKKDYAQLVRGLPGMIQINGLGQTLVFLLAKAEGDRQSAHRLAYEHLSRWVLSQSANAGVSSTDLIPWLLAQNSTVYRRATTEALAYLIWLKRFAEAQGWE